MSASGSRRRRRRWPQNKLEQRPGARRRRTHPALLLCNRGPAAWLSHSCGAGRSGTSHRLSWQAQNMHRCSRRHATSLTRTVARLSSIKRTRTELTTRHPPPPQRQPHTPASARPHVLRASHLAGADTRHPLSLVHPASSGAAAASVRPATGQAAITAQPDGDATLELAQPQTVGCSAAPLSGGDAAFTGLSAHRGRTGQLSDGTEPSTNQQRKCNKRHPVRMVRI